MPDSNHVADAFIRKEALIETRGNTISNGQILSYHGYELATWVNGIVVIRNGAIPVVHGFNRYFGNFIKTYPALAETPRNQHKMNL